MDLAEVLAELESKADPEHSEQVGRYNVPTDNWLGVRAPDMKELAKKIGVDHELALELWQCKWREAQVLVCVVADPKRVTEEQMDEWAAGFDNWAICDAFCRYLFIYTPFAHKKAFEWAGSEEEFVKRAAFSLMAYLAVHDKRASNEAFMQFLPVIKAESTDERNIVKKAVNWALRAIGKRNLALNEAAIRTSEEIIESNLPSARWPGRDALRELRSEKVQRRLREKASRT